MHSADYSGSRTADASSPGCAQTSAGCCNQLPASASLPHSGIVHMSTEGSGVPANLAHADVDTRHTAPPLPLHFHLAEVHSAA